MRTTTANWIRQPFASIVDAIAFIDGDDNEDFVYGVGTIGPDGNFPPAHAYRETDGDGTWLAGLFDDASADTPGASNVPEPSTGLLVWISLAGLLLLRRAR